MAVFAAFLLLAATVAGTSSTLPGQLNADSLQSASLEMESPQARPNSESVRSVRNNKRFKISLYLFRRN